MSSLEKQEHRHALPKGFLLYEYRIESILGKPGGFGITYLAIDTNLDQLVAIKEYLPRDFAVREGESTVCVRSTSDEDSFKWGLNCFIEEARVLARFNHANIVRVLRFFEAHGTAYMVMEYQQGKCLEDYLKERDPLSEEELLNVILPLLDGLQKIHEANFLHRDIKPENIYLRQDNTPVLLDFGSARYAIGQRSRHITAVITPGYSPLEQYNNDVHYQGPWTDIYSLGAVMYRIISGKTPPDATSRVMKEDPLVPAIQVGSGRYRKNLLTAVDWALTMDEDERPREIKEWRNKLMMWNDSFVPPPFTQIDSPDFYRSPMVIIGGAVITVLLIIITILVTYNIKQINYIATLETQVEDFKKNEGSVLEDKEKELSKAKKQLRDAQEELKVRELLYKQLNDKFSKIQRFTSKEETKENANKLRLHNKYWNVIKVEKWDKLYIREFPSASVPAVGEIPPDGKCIVYLCAFYFVNDNLWVKIRYKNTEGWVNSNFLIEGDTPSCEPQFNSVPDDKPCQPP